MFDLNLNILNSLRNVSLLGDTFPSILNLKITDKCQLKCKCCDSRSNVDLSYDLLKELLYLFQVNGGKLVNIFGGDPLLHVNIIELINLIKSYGLYLTINTNFSFLTNDIKHTLKNVDLLNVYLFGISNFNSIYNSDKLYLNNILHNTIDNKNNIRLLYYVSDPTDVRNVFEFSVNNSLNNLILKPVRGIVYSRSVLDQLFADRNKQSYTKTVVTIDNAFFNYDKIRDYNNCVYKLVSLFIDNNGNVFPCKDKCDYKYLYGNIHSYSLTDIIDGMLRSDVIQQDNTTSNCPPGMCQGTCFNNTYFYIENTLF